MNILITGGAGFIGTALYNQLTAHGHNVKRIDLDGANVPSDVIRMDLSSNLFSEAKDVLQQLISSSDVVYHLASSIGVQNVEDNPHKTLINSTRINELLLPMFQHCDTKLIFASTSEVYGDTNDIMTEDDNLSVTSPTNSMRGGYAAQKILGEFLTKSYAKKHTIVRFFNVVGPGQNPNIGMVVPNFIKQAKNNEDITIYGDGCQTRSYCDIRDAVNVLELLLTDMDNDILNIGASNVYSTNMLAEEIIRLSGSTSKIVHLDSRDCEIQHRSPDLNKMRTIYSPIYNLNEIIKSIL